MPYTITTTSERYADAHWGPLAHETVQHVTRHAVATLDELYVRATADRDGFAVYARAAHGQPWEQVTASFATAKTANEAKRAIRDLPEQGSTISLPDGTVIEVEPTTSWGGVPIGMARWLREEQGWSVPRAMDDAEAIAAYNAAQEES